MTVSSRLIQALEITAATTLLAVAMSADGQTHKKPAPAAPAPAPVVRAPAAPVAPPAPTPFELFQAGEAFADKNYESFLPPLPAAALVGPDNTPSQQGLGIRLGLGARHSPTEGLISGVAKDLDTFIATAKQLQVQSAFDKADNADPYLNGIKVEAARVFAISAQDAMNKFKQTVPLEQFLNQSDRHDTAQKVTIPAQNANYTVAFKIDPKAAVQMVEDTVEQAEGLALGLRVSIGEGKNAQKSTKFGNLTAQITNGGRTQNREYTGMEANEANHMSALLKQTATAFRSILTSPDADKPSNPYGAPQGAPAPSNPYATPPAKPVSPNPKESKLSDLPTPGNSTPTFTIGG